jgi:iron complex outermembrane receptor protein
MKYLGKKGVMSASVSAVAMLVSFSGSAFAADTAPAPAAAQADTPAGAGDIVVTARKRREDILKVPVTVSALTADQMEARGIRTVVDVAGASPGINLNNNSSSHADRAFQQIILRGFTPSTALVTTTSMFIDGVPVSSPTQLTSVSDPAQVEILKGPQSAYFGRNTFAGAINVVNKEPNGKWGAQVDGMVGTRGNWNVKGAIDGSIIGDKLTFRVTGSKMVKDGSWTNSADGKKLGDQSSAVGTLLIVAKPTDKLTMKLFGMIATDDDGAPAQARVNAYSVQGTNGQTIQNSQANCVINGNPFICGTLPALTSPVGANTDTAPIASYLASKRTLLNPSDNVQKFGLLRHTQHAHGVIDYTFSDHISAEVLAGFNHETYSDLIDLDGYDSSGLGWSYPYAIDHKNKDYSVEGRLSYKYGRLHGVVGASYLSAEGQNGLGAATSTTYSLGGVSKTKTFGAFFGATYDATDKLSLSVEGRYQIDTIAAYQGGTTLNEVSNLYLPIGTYAPNSLLGQQSFRNFAPRAIASYQFTPDLMVYASWAKGVNPSTFNTTIVTLSAAAQAQASATGIPLFAKPEKVTNYEVGAKGRLLDGALRYTLAAYYAQWTNQISSQYFFVGTSLYNGYANGGNVDLYGLEANTTWKVNKLISIDAAGAWNASRIITYNSATVTALTGISNFYGKEMPNTSKYSANVGVTIGDHIRGTSNASWYLRGDWNFKSGVWADQANVTRTPDLHLFNARLGADFGRYSASIFVNNLFNNHTYTSVSDNWVFTPNFSHTSVYSAAFVGLPDLRTVGLNVKIKI